MADLLESELESDLDQSRYFTNLEPDHAWNSTTFTSIPFIQPACSKKLDHLDLTMAPSIPLTHVYRLQILSCLPQQCPVYHIDIIVSYCSLAALTRLIMPHRHPRAPGSFYVMLMQ